MKEYRTKRNKKRRRFTADQKKQFCAQIPATTLFDFFYRLRIRSNYEMPMHSLLEM